MAKKPKAPVVYVLVHPETGEYETRDYDCRGEDYYGYKAVKYVPYNPRVARVLKEARKLCEATMLSSGWCESLKAAVAAMDEDKPRGVK